MWMKEWTQDQSLLKELYPNYEDETRETLQVRIQQTEHELYPAVLQKFFNNKMTHRGD